jgi:hypothetical protein
MVFAIGSLVDFFGAEDGAQPVFPCLERSMTVEPRR